MTTRHNWRHGQKVVWTDDDGKQFLGEIVGETWKRITVDFSEHPVYGIFEDAKTTRVVRASEIRLQENESLLLRKASTLGFLALLDVEELCKRHGCPLNRTQSLLISHSVRHNLFNQIMENRE